LIPRANIVAWRSVAPWLADSQVEQDLVLSSVNAGKYLIDLRTVAVGPWNFNFLEVDGYA